MGEGSERSLERIGRADLIRLAELAAQAETGLFTRNPDGAGRYAGRLLCRALCQGAARHYLDGATGVKDFGCRAWQRETTALSRHHEMPGQEGRIHDLWARDPAFVALMARLRTGSPEFAAWWESHDIRRSMAGQKVFYYPDREPLRFEYVTFQTNDDPALKLAIYTPA